MEKNYVILTIVLALILSIPAIAAAPRGFIGDTGSGWDTSGTVSARSSYSHPVQHHGKTIDGSGIDADGLLHGNGNDDNWYSYSMIPDPDAYDASPPTAEYNGKSRYSGACGYGSFGDGPGNSLHWIEYDLGGPVILDEMWLWNYAQGDLGGWAWSCQGMQSFQIHATAIPETDPGCASYGWGTSDTTRWTLIYDSDVDGEIPPYGPGDPRDANVIDFGGIVAQYVVITVIPDAQGTGSTSSAHDLNYSEEKRGLWTDGVGIAEVRFYGSEMAPKCYIGDNGVDWDSTSAVTARAGHQHPSRTAADTINGSGFDTNGLVHDNDPCNMWYSYTFCTDPDGVADTDYAAGPEWWGAGRYTGSCGMGTPGAAPGNSAYWIEYKFDDIYTLNEMWIWNYAEGDLFGYAWSCFGMQMVEIYVTTAEETDPGCPSHQWGSSDPAQWTLVYAGPLNYYGIGEPRTMSTMLDLGGVDAKYVVISAPMETVADNHNLNWTEELRGIWSDGVGLSEVRFYTDVECPPQTCSEAIGRGFILEHDYSENCVVDVPDFADHFFPEWLKCTTPDSEGCEPAPGFTAVPSIPAGTANVDADLADWAGADWMDLDVVNYWRYGASDADDLSDCKWAIRWDDASNLLYIAVSVTDSDLNLLDSHGDWNLQDCIEVYVDAGNSNVNNHWPDPNNAQQYRMGAGVTAGVEWVNLNMVGTPPAACVPEFQAAVNGNVITYEMSITPYDLLDTDNMANSTEVDLADGVILGVDVIACTRRSSGNWGGMGEDNVQGRYNDASLFIDRVIGTATCGDWGYLDMDFNKNCTVELGDFAEIAKDWLRCIDPADPGCETPWIP